MYSGEMQSRRPIDVSLSEPMKTPMILGSMRTAKSPGPEEKVVVGSGFNEWQTERLALTETVPYVQTGIKDVYVVACSRKRARMSGGGEFQSKRTDNLVESYHLRMASSRRWSQLSCLGKQRRTP